MVAWWRTLQVILTMVILWGAGAIITYVYDTTNYTHGFIVIIVGSIILTLMILWVGTIQNNIENRRR